MNSMTGYGHGEAEVGGVSVVAEIRSVNSRYRDVHFRAPREYASIEPRVKSLLKARFARGRLDVTLNRRSEASGGRVSLDRGLAEQYRDALAELAELAGGEPAVTAAVLAQAPGVLSVSEPEVDAGAEWPAVEAALSAAATSLAEMRAMEGRSIEADLTLHLDRLSELRERAVLASDLGEQLSAKMAARLERILGEQIEPQRLIQEVAVLVDKADVSEEMARLESHLQQFRAALVLGEPVGRRMDFLSQEIHREINTCGSKSASVELSELVVEMKSTLERLREQVANAE